MSLAFYKENIACDWLFADIYYGISYYYYTVQLYWNGFVP